MILRTVYIPYKLNSWLRQMAFTRSVMRSDIAREVIADALAARAQMAQAPAVPPAPDSNSAKLQTLYLTAEIDNEFKTLAHNLGITKSHALVMLMDEGREIWHQRGERSIAEQLNERAKNNKTPVTPTPPTAKRVKPAKPKAEKPVVLKMPKVTFGPRK